MSLFQVYDLRNRKVEEILKDYYTKYGAPPQILHVNKVDSESKFEGVEVAVERWVLPNHLFFEVSEVENEA